VLCGRRLWLSITTRNIAKSAKEGSPGFTFGGSAASRLRIRSINMRWDDPPARLPDQPIEIRTPAIRISITHKITRYPSANLARRSAFSAKPSLEWPRPDIRSMLGNRCSRRKSFSIAQQQQSSTRPQSRSSLGPGGIGDRFIGVSPCLRLNTFTSNFLIALLNNAFGAASGSR
jgi:hypothetical protein